MKGQFGPNGALYSGWETRRHNPAYDWCIIQLGTPGAIVGFDVDTANFNGNEAPAVSIEALYTTDGDPQKDDNRWQEIMPRTPLGPNSRHLFSISPTKSVNFVRLNMYPDGGIARFRVYGHVTPVRPSDLRSFDLAHVFAGGRVEFVSDQHFGVGSNLILPGRGENMGDGWETKRNRGKGHRDWVIIKLGAPGNLEQVEIDTAHFKGNFPESCELYALFSDHDINWKTQRDDDLEWTLILPRTKLGPHRQHYFQLENVKGNTFTHVRVVIYPDGGIKRVRIIGRTDMSTTAVGSLPTAEIIDIPSRSDSMTPAPQQAGTLPMTTIPVLPLTPEAFAPFGQVIQAYGDHAAAPKGTRITPANDGTANKFHKLSLLASSYPSDARATAGISVYRCQPLAGIAEDGTVELTALERHPFTNQAFIPMGHGSGEGLSKIADKYLVVVAKNGEDDRPDLGTVRAFVASTAQGVAYNTAVWHQPMTVLGKSLDLACVETQIGDGSGLDCEIVDVEGRVRLQVV